MEGEGSVPHTRMGDRAAQYLALFLAIAVGVLLIIYTQKRPDSSDSIGYLYAAERLAAGEGLTYEDSHNSAAGPYFTLYAFQVRREGDPRAYLGFPPGFPLLLASVMLLTGTRAAATYLVPLLAAASIFLAYVLGSKLSGSRWVGLWAALFTGLAPVLWEFGTAPWSEIPSMLLLIAGFALFLLSSDPQRPHWKLMLFSLLGGLLVGFSFFVRYANILLLPAFLFFELAYARTKIVRERWRWPFYFMVLASLIAVLLFNHYYYGGVTTTSYSARHGWYPYPAFSISYALGPSFVGGHSFIEALKTLWNNYSVLLILAPVGWLLLPKASGIASAAAAIAILLFYSFYAFAPVGINSRFLIPMLPFIAIGIGQSIVMIGRLLRRPWTRLVGGAAIALLFMLPVVGEVEKLEQRNASAEAVVEEAIAYADLTEPDAVFMSYRYNDLLRVYGGRSVLNYRRIPLSNREEGRFRLEMMEPCLSEAVESLLENDTPVYYLADQVPSFWESLEILQANFKMEPLQSAPEVYQITAPLPSAGSTEPQPGYCW